MKRLGMTLSVLATVFAWSAAQTGFAATAAPGAPETPKPPPLHFQIEGFLTPDWTQLPTADQMSEFYPKLATYLNLPARVQLSCLTTNNGDLEHCVVDTERPAGLGFSAAALSLAGDFHLKPRQVGGVARGGDEVTFVIVFKMPEAEKPAAPANDAPPNPEALAAARQLLVASGAQASVMKDSGAYSRMMMSQLGDDGSHTPQEEEAFQSYDQAAAAVVPTYLELMATAYARFYSVAEMRAITAFLQTPAGRAWTAHQSDISKVVGKNWQTLADVVNEDARRRLCLKIKCWEPRTNQTAAAEAH